MACGPIFGRAKGFLLYPGGLHTGNHTVFTVPMVKRPRRGADYSPPRIVDVKNGRSFTSLPAIHLRGVHGDSVTLTVFFFFKPR